MIDEETLPASETQDRSGVLPVAESNPEPPSENPASAENSGEVDKDDDAVGSMQDRNEVRPADSVPYAEQQATANSMPSLADMVRDAGADNERAKRGSIDALMVMLNHAGRLWSARVDHELGGDSYVDFAKRIGIDRSTAFELVKLHPYREGVIARIKVEAAAATARGLVYIAPSWKKALANFEPKAGKKMEHKAPKSVTDVVVETKTSADDELLKIKEELATARQTARSERVAKEELAERLAAVEQERDAALAEVALLKTEIAALRGDANADESAKKQQVPLDVRGKPKRGRRRESTVMETAAPSTSLRASGAILTTHPAPPGSTLIHTGAA
jgi:hypothetical protein